jgi:hypothetical protein
MNAEHYREEHELDTETLADAEDPTGAKDADTHGDSAR